ncbi:hypothetical protein ACJMK2_015799 [Sinanodonta woodiana]|uniref:C1q domain-containing protein n=1 Tax=Sinanodonta woodiana TaxID=1069815 RepID=A0ABD3USZ2_SINWO
MKLIALLALLFVVGNFYGGYVCSQITSGNEILSLSKGAAESLLSLLVEERDLSARLEQEVTQLEREIKELRSHVNNASCGCAATHGPVVFTVSLTSTIANLGVNQEVLFDTILTNVGNGYDVRHGTFSAPVTGTYEFTLSVLITGVNTAGLELVKNGEVIARAKVGEDKYSQYNMAMNVAAIEMVAGEEVWVRHLPGSDSNVIIGSGYALFSGQFLQV